MFDVGRRLVQGRVVRSHDAPEASKLRAEEWPSGIFFNGSDRANHARAAMLHLTLTGKESTASLAAVTDWPTTEDWPAGVAPASVVVGIHYAGGQIISQRYNFAVRVP